MVNITHFPDLPPHNREFDKEECDEDDLHSDFCKGTDLTVTRLIEFYENFSSLPFDKFDSESLNAILCAIDEDRHQDALDLVDMVIDGIDLSTSGGEALESPIPHVAQFARFGAPVERSGRPDLHVVGQACPVPAMQATVSLRSSAMSDWVAGCGDFLFNREGKSRLELGLKGELILILFAGTLTVHEPDGDVAMLSCQDGEYLVLQIVYCRGRRSHDSFVLEFESDPNRPARGLWCNSHVETLSEKDRAGDPDHDMLFTRNFHAVQAEVTPGGKFCSGARPLPAEGYSHGDSVARGELARFGFELGGFGARHGWAFGSGPDATNITGMQAGPSPVAEDEGNRPLIVHPGIELLVALDGVTWVAVNPEKPQTDRGGYMPRELHTEPHSPVFVAPLVAPETGGHDAMLLDPSFRHSAWMVPASPARFLHVCFSYPREIKPAKLSKSRPDLLRSGPKHSGASPG